MIDPLSAETALLVAPAVLLLWAFWVLRSESAVRRDWLVLLNPQSEKVYNRIERHVRAEMDRADLSYDEAYALRARGSADQARQLLKVGSHTMERLTPSMLRLLSASTRRIVDGRAHAERAWEHIRAIRHDLETLSHETLDSLRVLLVSIAAEKREDLLRRL